MKRVEKMAEEFSNKQDTARSAKAYREGFVEGFTYARKLAMDAFTEPNLQRMFRKVHDMGQEEVE